MTAPKIKLAAGVFLTLAISCLSILTIMQMKERTTTFNKDNIKEEGNESSLDKELLKEEPLRFLWEGEEEQQPEEKRCAVEQFITAQEGEEEPNFISSNETNVNINSEEKEGKAPDTDDATPSSPSSFVFTQTWCRVGCPCCE
jgi:hypothetical protein